MKKQARFRAVLLAVVIGSTTVQAQNYAIQWQSIDGGGGVSSGGAFALSGTVGQVDTGALSGGAYGLQGGFWSGVFVLPTPGAPQLSISRAGNNVLLSWPASAIGFELEATVGLVPPSWKPAPQPPVLSGDRWTVLVVPTGILQVYRLRHP